MNQVCRRLDGLNTTPREDSLKQLFWRPRGTGHSTPFIQQRISPKLLPIFHNFAMKLRSVVLTLLTRILSLKVGVESQRIAAKAVIHLAEIFHPQDPAGGIPARRGVIDFVQEFPNGPVKITGSVLGLVPGNHGLHIHELGNLDKGCTSASGEIHWTATFPVIPGPRVCHSSRSIIDLR